MLAIQPSKKQSQTQKCSPNLLPCAVHHNGEVQIDDRHWEPKTQDDGTSIAHLRGRKLVGKKVDIPEGYKGVAVRKTDNLLPETKPRIPAEDLEEEDEEESVETKMGEETLQFDHIMVWGHETALPDGEDPHIKAMQEWIAFAESAHQV